MSAASIGDSSQERPSRLQDLNNIPTGIDGKVECPDCGLRLAHKASLLRHMNSQHRGLYQYVCDLCGKGFCVKENLSGHLYSKHNQKEHGVKCPVCKKTFAHGYNMKSHVKVAHPDFLVTSTKQTD